MKTYNLTQTQITLIARALHEKAESDIEAVKNILEGRDPEDAPEHVQAVCNTLGDQADLARALCEDIEQADSVTFTDVLEEGEEL